MSAFRPLVAIVGPTAVGKTERAITLARRLDGEIVSADSRLLYRGMDVGTAKPTPEQRVLVPHYLIDVAEPEDVWSLAQFRVAALEAIRCIQERGRLPLLVGGTGQYVTAILEGWTPPARPGDETTRRMLERYASEHGASALYARLQAVDPEAAVAIDSRNVRRVVRALEVFEATGVPMSRARRREPPPFKALRIGLTLPRPELFARIDARIDQMLDNGLVDEVRRLLGRGLSPTAPALSAIGYREIVLHLGGECDLEEAVRRMRRATRQFVRRQANWFKPSDPRILWFESRDGVEDDIERCVRQWLAEEAGTTASADEAEEEPEQRR